MLSFQKKEERPKDFYKTSKDQIRDPRYVAWHTEKMYIGERGELVVKQGQDAVNHKNDNIRPGFVRPSFKPRQGPTLQMGRPTYQVHPTGPTMIRRTPGTIYVNNPNIKITRIVH